MISEHSAAIESSKNLELQKVSISIQPNLELKVHDIVAEVKKIVSVAF